MSNTYYPWGMGITPDSPQCHLWKVAVSSRDDLKFITTSASSETDAINNVIASLPHVRSDVSKFKFYAMIVEESKLPDYGEYEKAAREAMLEIAHMNYFQNLRPWATPVHPVEIS